MAKSATDKHRRLLLPFFLIVAALLLLISVLTVLTTASQNHVALERSVHLARSVFNDRMIYLSKKNYEYAYWNEAVEAVEKLLSENDREWLDANIADFYYEDESIESTFIINAENQVIYGATKSSPDGRNPLTTFNGGLIKLADAARRNDNPLHPKLTHGIVANGDELFMAAASEMINYETVNAAVHSTRTGYILIAIKAITPDYLKAIESSYLLKNLAVGRIPSPDNEASFELRNPDGKVAGSMYWTAETPGTEMLVWLAPAVLGFGLIIIVGSVFYARRIHATAAEFVDAISARQMAENRLNHARKMESLGNLAGGMAHHLNNLFLPIQALTYMVQQSFEQSSAEFERLGKVIEAGEKASVIVQKILTFARTHDARKSTAEITSTVRDCMSLVRSAIPSNITLTVDIEDHPYQVSIDSENIEIALMNLTSNAIYAMNNKKGVLSVTLSRVELSDSEAEVLCLETGQYARLIVSDTGTGIDDDMIARIFDPFFTTKPAGSGTGLGLAAVHGIITSHGGIVTCDSAPGRGASFTLYFPVAET